MNSQTLDTTNVLTDQSVRTLARESHPPSPVDRLAMRVGIALILWSRHHNTPSDVTGKDWETAADRNREARERETRERTWLESGYSVPQR